MSKKNQKYTCVDCKEPFRNRFALTAHIRFCKKGLRPPGKEGKVECPECKAKCAARGLGSHRRAKHGVAGSSRWSLKARKAKAAQKGNRAALVNPMPAVTMGGTSAVPVFAKIDMGNGHSDLVKKLLEEAIVHRTQANKHTAAADKLAKMAVELKEML